MVDANRENRLLEPSELGTQQYWEASYERELRNHGEDASDEGIIWFDESNAERTVLKTLASYGDASGRNLLHRNSCRFLDLGTGNGHMLFELRESEDGLDENLRWTGEMVGVDYSPRSIQLAQRIDSHRVSALTAEAESADDYATIRFETWDLLVDAPGNWLGHGFDVVLDKGTFDAISLMPHDGDSQHPCDVYREKVTALVKHGSFLFITSCNWTKSELVDWLVPQNSELRLFDEAKYSTFTFGGQTGQSVVTLIFQRRHENT